MYLSKLFKPVGKKYQKVYVKGICFDSRKVKKGDIFFAIKGNKISGTKFIQKAILRRASAIVVDSKVKLKNLQVPLLRVRDARESLSEACSNFYKKKPPYIVAVTGTNGKTSVANFFFQLFELNKIPAASIGTLGIESNFFKKKTNLTSPDPLLLHKSLSELKKKGINIAVLEASSHGLDQKRLDHITFKAAVFTNLSREHLDYHKNMDRYLNSKLYLFNNLLSEKKFCITDKDNIFFNKLKKICEKKKIKINSIGYGCGNLKILSQKYKNGFQEIEFSYNHKTHKLKTYLFGQYQIKNLLFAILLAEKCGLNIKKSLKKTKHIKAAKGRLECIKKLKNNSQIFIDFAHTPDALERVLKNLKFQFNKNISIVFGCGGDRDKGKRSIMGHIASKYCKKIYLTDDNPRFENPKNIRRAIKKGIKIDFTEAKSRKFAIQLAIKELGYNEILLIAGKGHEQYQDFGSKKIHFSDENEIKKFFTNKKKQAANSFWHPCITSEVFSNYNHFNFSNVSINSKQVNFKSLFFAIKGKRKDGHNFVKEAIARGAEKVVVDKSIRGINSKKLIRVPNTLIALNNLAKATRQHTKAKIIGITGSSGKTTLKDMTSFVLKNFDNTSSSKSSFNNHYGVPLSLSNLREKDVYGVFELGMDKKGEINSLSKILKPNIGVITNISSAHIKNFKSQKEIAEAKSEIINNLVAQGTLILNRDDKFYKYIAQIATKKNVQIKSFGLNKYADLYLKNIRKNKNIYQISISYNNKIYLLNIKYNNNTYIQNVLSTCLIIFNLNLDISGKKNIFLNFKIPEGRGDINKIKIFEKKFYLLDESYNANPHSMRLAINHFNNIDKKKTQKILLLGDMLELGKKTKFFHRNLAKYINSSNIDKVFVIGKSILETYKFVKKNKKGKILNTMSDIGNLIRNYIKDNDYVMIKGSNLTGLNDFCRKLKKGKIN
jgi:murE/murF fusion protein